MGERYLLKFHPDVEKELQEIFTWYEEKQNGLGNDFLQSFYSSTDSILENPFQYPKKYKNFHRYLLHKFPYAIYFIIEDDLIIIMGVFHHARDPKKIKPTLSNRKE
jgi:plasmid stabilization system protein ParE